MSSHRSCPSPTSSDLVHVATCHDEGIGTIVSPDRGLDAVPGLVRVDPGDPVEVDRLTG